MKKAVMMLVLAMGAGAQAELKPGQIKIFNDADKNKDGKVCVEEWTPVVEARFEKQGKTGWEAQAPKQFNFMDKDKDGFLSLEEFWPGKK